MDEITLKLTLSLRGDFRLGPNHFWDGLSTLPLWSLPPANTLCYMVTKRKAACPDPIWHCFDTHVYTKDAQDDVMSKLRKYDSAVFVQEQKISTWPSSPITINLCGTQVDTYTASAHQFCSPTKGQEFQRSFPIYFKKKSETTDPIQVNFSVKILTATLIDEPLLFNWHEADTCTKERIRSISIQGKRAVGIQNNAYIKCKRNARCSAAVRALFQSNVYCQEETSPPSSLSDTEGSGYYEIEEDSFEYSKESKNYEEKTDEFQHINLPSTSRKTQKSSADFGDHKTSGTGTDDMQKQLEAKILETSIINSTPAEEETEVVIVPSSKDGGLPKRKEIEIADAIDST